MQYLTFCPIYVLKTICTVSQLQTNKALFEWQRTMLLSVSFFTGKARDSLPVPKSFEYDAKVMQQGALQTNTKFHTSIVSRHSAALSLTREETLPHPSWILRRMQTHPEKWPQGWAGNQVVGAHKSMQEPLCSFHCSLLHLTAKVPLAFLLEYISLSAMLTKPTDRGLYTQVASCSISTVHQGQHQYGLETSTQLLVRPHPRSQTQSTATESKESWVSYFRQPQWTMCSVYSFGSVKVSEC